MGGTRLSRPSFARDSKMLMPFTKILDNYRCESFSEANKGTRFEELIREYLWADPKYGFYLKDIWLWRDFLCLTRETRIIDGIPV